MEPQFTITIFENVELIISFDTFFDEDEKVTLVDEWVIESINGDHDPSPEAIEAMYQRIAKDRHAEETILNACQEAIEQ